MNSGVCFSLVELSYLCVTSCALVPVQQPVPQARGKGWLGITKNPSLTRNFKIGIKAPKKYLSDLWIDICYGLWFVLWFMVFRCVHRQIQKRVLGSKLFVGCQWIEVSRSKVFMLSPLLTRYNRHMRVHVYPV